jgi:hypothetical protein
MTEPTAAPEVIEPEVMKRELAVLAPAEAEPLKTAFLTMFGQAEKWVAQAKSIVVTDATDLRGMKLARETRLAIREIRCNGENARKKLKADIVLKGRAIDGIANVLKALCEPAEAHLEEQEKFAERAEAKRIADLVAVRSAELVALAVDPAFYRLGDMTPEAYAQLVASIKAAAAAKIEAERVAEAARIAAIEADKAERARVAAENARLKAESEEREKAAKIERETAAKALSAAEAKAKAEREKAAAEAAKAAEQARKEREAIEAKAKAERDEAVRVAAEQKKIADAEALKEKQAREKAEAELAAQRKAAADKAAAETLAAQQAAAAPDRIKIVALANVVRGIAIPEMSTENGKTARAEIAAKVEQFAKWIEGKAKAL